MSVLENKIFVDVIRVRVGVYMKSCVTNIQTNNKKEIGTSMRLSFTIAMSHLTNINCPLNLNL